MVQWVASSLKVNSDDLLVDLSSPRVPELIPVVDSICESTLGIIQKQIELRNSIQTAIRLQSSIFATSSADGNVKRGLDGTMIKLATIRDTIRIAQEDIIFAIEDIRDNLHTLNYDKQTIQNPYNYDVKSKYVNNVLYDVNKIKKIMASDTAIKIKINGTVSVNGINTIRFWKQYEDGKYVEGYRHGNYSKDERVRFMDEIAFYMEQYNKTYLQEYDVKISHEHPKSAVKAKNLLIRYFDNYVVTRDEGFLIDFLVRIGMYKDSVLEEHRLYAIRNIVNNIHT